MRLSLTMPGRLVRAGRNGAAVFSSLRCDDKADITIVVPDDKGDAIYALVDLKRRGKSEGIVFDMGRTQVERIVLGYQT